ncbi:DUF898 family protein [Scandinavium sp. TWS1a]|uniref:YjgN family protein n=1 Tax=Scandinavium tedordense TaxID=2926521 RepID=UPI0021658885|nr:DUF898 family protein [Scandinavium tedordense]MCS2169388.1 DUF898 family protein [Scandinavium tedordense]
MTSSEVGTANSQHVFVFHGKAWPFFLICLGNLLLTIITLGIYLPWAYVKSRRYIYKNMELNGVHFDYHATGGAFLVSWLLVGLIFIVLTLVCESINLLFGFLPILLLWALMPLMMAKGLRYQAMMTRLNDVRFGFKCSVGKVMWTMLGLPLLLGIAVIFFLFGVNRTMGIPESTNGGLIQLAVLGVLGLLSVGITNGFMYGKWMHLLGNHTRFGIHPFRIDISLKRCMAICIAAMLILVPFAIVIVKLMAPFYSTLFKAMGQGEMDPAISDAVAQEYIPQIIVSYVLYFIAIVLMSIFSKASLRNQFINGLRLGDSLTFRSSLTFVGLLMQILVLILATMCTFGLAYPWAKMCYMRYLASNTCVVGELDDVELDDTDGPNDSGFFAIISRGMMVATPFI